MPSQSLVIFFCYPEAFKFSTAATRYVATLLFYLLMKAYELLLCYSIYNEDGDVLIRRMQLNHTPLLL